MEVWQRFEPRNSGAAKTVLFVLSWAAAGVTIVFTIVTPNAAAHGHVSVPIGACLALLAVVTAIKVLRYPPRFLWAAYPLAAIVLITVLDVVTVDSSASAQIFFFFPVLYAGSQLRRPATVAVCVLAIAGQATVALWLQPVGVAIIDICFVGAALTTSAALLMHGAERTDDLIAILARQAAIDPLTGLSTRRVMDSAATSTLGGAASDGGTALLLMDVDHFKQINDAHGHLAGDAVLQEIATLLLRLHRRGDVMSRMGGDEIAVLLPGCTLRVALARAEEILLEVQAHTFDVTAQSMAHAPASDVCVPVSLSIGVAHLPTHADDLRALYAAADAALYQAKNGGRGRVAALHADTRG